MKNKRCFTLAEVLITLSILGVVAAISIPNMVQQYKKRLTITKLQKAYSEVNQLATNISVNSGCFNQNISCTQLLASGNYNDRGHFNQDTTNRLVSLANFNSAKIESKQLRYNYLNCERNKNCKTNVSLASDAILVHPSHNQYSFVFGKFNSAFVQTCSDDDLSNGIPAMFVYVITEPKKSLYTMGRNLFVLSIYDNFKVSSTSINGFGHSCPAEDAGGSGRINTYCTPDNNNYSSACYAKIIHEGWKINY